jgi:hypothetical protein
MGSPAQPLREYLKGLALLRRLGRGGGKREEEDG